MLVFLLTMADEQYCVHREPSPVLLTQISIFLLM